MSLRKFFESNDAVSVYKRSLMAAVKDASPEKLQEVLKTDIDAPPEVLGSVLDKTLRNNQLRLAEILMKAGAQASQVSGGTIRTLVQNYNSKAYRMLAEAGINFDGYKPSENGGWYVNCNDWLKKNLECEYLKEELAQVKNELSTLKESLGLPKDPPPGDKPKSFSL
ncbi:MAG: hypothetical protein ACAH80_09980 [Alphaproteobacteria bacterium]